MEEEGEPEVEGIGRSQLGLDLEEEYQEYRPDERASYDELKSGIQDLI